MTKDLLKYTNLPWTADLTVSSPHNRYGGAGTADSLFTVNRELIYCSVFIEEQMWSIPPSVPSQ
jgi:hypothetical protein